jgi:hypothetical protein
VQERTPRPRPWTRRRLVVVAAVALAAAVFAGGISRQVLMGVAAPLLVVGVALLNEGLNARRLALAKSAERRNAQATGGTGEQPPR